MTDTTSSKLSVHSCQGEVLRMPYSPLTASRREISLTLNCSRLNSFTLESL